MISPPSNLRAPKEPTILSDYKRDAKGNIFTKGGFLLEVDENKNLVRDENKDLRLLDGTIVEVHKDDENKGKPIKDEYTPIQQDNQRYIGGFPIFKDGVLMGWNEYRNNRIPIYFMRKDRGRHHYII